jgi:hypothetical protein
MRVNNNGVSYASANRTTKFSFVISAFWATSVVVIALMIAAATSFLTSGVRHALGSQVTIIDGILASRGRH